MSTKFFLYARKSTESEERQALSIEAQITELKLFAEREKLHIVRHCIESQSAKTPGRPIFNDMINCIERGEARGIVAWHPDRLARNSVDGGKIVWLLDTLHIAALKFPTFWFENTPQGKFMLNIAFGQSKYYVDNLVENIKRGQRQKLRRGEFPGKAPPGYINDYKSRKIVVDVSKAPLITKLFQHYAEGNLSFEAAAQLGQQMGLIVKSGKPYAVSKINRILTNSIYYGLFKWSGEAYLGVHEPLISKALFDRVQEIITARTKPSNKTTTSFPYVGLANCSNCGFTVTAERQKGHSYYHCSRRSRTVKCREPFVREEALDEQITRQIQSVALPQSGFAQLSTWLNQEAQSLNDGTAHEITNLQSTLKNLNIKLDRLLDAHLEGALEKVEYLTRKERFLSDKIQIDDKIKKLQTGAMPWFEPCANFLKAANKAHLLAASQNKGAKKRFLKIAGSNHHLAARVLTGDWRAPWNLVAQFSSNFNDLHAPAAHQKCSRPLNAGVDFCQNAIQITRERAALKEMFRD